MVHAGTTESRQTVGGSSSSIEFSSGGGSAEMISDGGPYANREILVKRVGEHLLPTAQAWRLCRPGPSVAAPGTETVISTWFATSFQVRPWSCSSTICCVEAG